MRTSAPHRQRGAALLLMMLVVLVAATAVLVNRLNRNEIRTQQQADAQGVLAAARAALIDYATVLPDLAPGEAAKLPCPDVDASGGLLEGEAHGSACGAAGVSVLGRLPWRTLGIAALQDSGGACLWYVVSGSHKDADTASAGMVNDDSSGQLQLLSIETGQVIAGAQSHERPVALVIAPMQAVPGQGRAAPAPDDLCSSSYRAADFLDSDSGTGTSNAVLSATADAVDRFAASAGFNESHNDRIATITLADLEQATNRRHDFNTSMRNLGLAVSACIAEYAASNPGGSNDRRMPWPAPMQLADYRMDALYDDADTGLLSGRLPDAVDDSNASTGNSIARQLTDCDPVAVPAWTPEMLALWRNWKDHFFYAVAESFSPAAPVPSVCSTCLTVNSSGQNAAIVLFSDRRLSSLDQVRTMPPVDADTRDIASNYLEGLNASNVPYTSGSVDFTSQSASNTFNDLLFCIDPALNVTEC